MSGAHYLSPCDCRSWRECQMHELLAALSHNLLAAAMLERAFRLGNANDWDEAAISEGYKESGSWEPGTGKTAP